MGRQHPHREKPRSSLKNCGNQTSLIGKRQKTMRSEKQSSWSSSSCGWSTGEKHSLSLQLCRTSTDLSSSSHDSGDCNYSMDALVVRTSLRWASINSIMLVPQLGDQKNTKNHLQTDTVQVMLDNISIKLRIKTERRQTHRKWAELWHQWRNNVNWKHWFHVSLNWLTQCWLARSWQRGDSVRC